MGQFCLHLVPGAADHGHEPVADRDVLEAGAALASRMMCEAMSYEAISCHFWPGSGPVQEAEFYAYSPAA
jgi:Family of unknown function (DUF5996)